MENFAKSFSSFKENMKEFKQKFKKNRAFNRDSNMFEDESEDRSANSQFNGQNGENKALIAIKLKEEANECMRNDQIEQAIQLYGQALNYNPSNPVVFCNRAQAYKKTKQFQLMYDDSVTAIELDDNSYKAYLKNGEACLELSKNKNHKNTDMAEKGLKRLLKAISILEKLKPSNPQYNSKKKLIQQVERQMLRGKKILYFKQQILQAEKDELLFKQIQQISIQSNCNQDDKDQAMTDLRQYFELKHKQQKNLEIPSYLICPITDDLMEEPVTLKSGFTYDKANIIKHFEVNGNFDPMTREAVCPSPEQLTVNQSIKHATEEFLRQNPWAYEYLPGDNIHTVEM